MMEGSSYNIKYPRRSPTTIIANYRIFLLFNLIIIVAVTVLTVVDCYPTYRDQIPNGHRVPNPYHDNTDPIWNGVGHFAQEGGGKRNPFGLDFAANGHVWTPELCRKDSDSDGRTNGVELGDPDCIWDVNNNNTWANITMPLSHPGLNENDLPARKKPFDTCDQIDTKEIDESQVIEFLVPNATITNTRTTYQCHSFVFPADRHRHMIAVEPIITSPIIHHIIMYECDDFHELSDKECEAARSMLTGCKPFFGWAVSTPKRFCSPQEAGWLIGRDSTSKKDYGIVNVLMQVHYDNYLGTAVDITQPFGMRMYLQDSLRKFDVGMFNNYIFIVTWKTPTKDDYNAIILPPGEKEVKVHGWCRSSCTRKQLDEPINIFAYTFHMHELGRKAVAHRQSCNEKKQEMFRNDDFSFNTQDITFLQDYLQIHPGDSVHVTCTFDTSSRNETVYGGIETVKNEMCSLHMAYYPYQREVGTCMSGNEMDDFFVCDTEELNEMMKSDQSAWSVKARRHGWAASRFFLALLALWLSSEAAHRGLKRYNKVYPKLDVNNQRNVVTYILQIFWGTFIGILALPPLGTLYVMCDDVLDILNIIETTAILFTALYMYEIVYRLKMRFSLIFHHMVATCFVVFYVMELTEGRYLAVKIALIHIIFSAMEQPNFIALLVYRLSNNVTQIKMFFTIAVVWQAIGKIITHVVSIAFYIVEWDQAVLSLRILFPFFTVLIGYAQFMSFMIQRQILLNLGTTLKVKYSFSTPFQTTFEEIKKLTTFHPSATEDDLDNNNNNSNGERRNSFFKVFTWGGEEMTVATRQRSRTMATPLQRSNSSLHMQSKGASMMSRSSSNASTENLIALQQSQSSRSSVNTATGNSNNNNNNNNTSQDEIELPERLVHHAKEQEEDNNNNNNNSNNNNEESSTVEIRDNHHQQEQSNIARKRSV